MVHLLIFPFCCLILSVHSGLGHPDTSGVSTIDYYVSDEVELPPSYSTAGSGNSLGVSLYSETLVLMAGLGTCFVDRVRDQAVALQSPRYVMMWCDTVVM